MTCPLCDGTGYKDHAGFAMDPCDHEKGPTVRPTPQSFTGVQKTRDVRCSKPAHNNEPKRELNENR